MENAIKNKSIKSAKRIINLYKFLCDEKTEFILSKQILSCGTSIGANVTEAEHGISKKAFQTKMYIAFKECAETLYWLELLYSTNYLSQKEYISLYNDCDELRKILSSIIKTIKMKEVNNEKIKYNSSLLLSH